jgi:transcriptional antiterminator RfaH
MKHWYVLHTKPHSERQVAATLAEIDDVEAYLPEVELRQGKKKRKRVPFFPCYLFMRADIEKVSSSLWEWTPGLRRVVAFDDRPTAVPDQVIDLIRAKLKEIGKASGLSRHSFKKGDVVRIARGPFAEMLAVFEGPSTARERVQVLLNFLGRLNRLHLEIDDVEKAPPGAVAPEPKPPRRSRGRGRPIKRD